MSRPPTQPPRPTGPTPPPRPTKSIPAAEVLYPVAELAEMWRCSTSHIYNLIAARKLRVVQIGTGRAKTRIPSSAAAEFIAGGGKKRAA